MTLFTVSEIRRLSVEKAHNFLLYLYLTPNLKVLSLHCIAKILLAKSCDTGLINLVISFLVKLSVSPQYM